MPMHWKLEISYALVPDALHQVVGGGAAVPSPPVQPEPPASPAAATTSRATTAAAAVMSRGRGCMGPPQRCRGMVAVS